MDVEALSLRQHGGETPPTSGPGEGDVTTPYSRSMAGTTVALLLRGIKREPQPLPFTLEVLVAGVLSAPAFAFGSAGGIDGSTDPGTWRWRCTSTSSPRNMSQRSYG